MPKCNRCGAELHRLPRLDERPPAADVIAAERARGVTVLDEVIMAYACPAKTCPAFGWLQNFAASDPAVAA